MDYHCCVIAMSDRKIRKLSEMIDDAKKAVEELEEKLEKARTRCDLGEITKAEYTKARMDISDRIRGKRGSIVRYEKARLNAERLVKDKKLEEEEELKKRQELRVERRHEKDKERRRRMRGGEKNDEPEEKPKKKGFFSFFSK
jgi:hypothetical protein